MSFADSQFAGSTKTLLNESAICWLNFSFNKISLNSWHYATVRYYIESGQISCKVDATKVGSATAVYDTKAKTIFGKDNDMDYAFQKSTLIHECTHAALDVLKTQTDILTDETCAYLAQGLYIIASKVQPQFDSGSIADLAYKAVKAKGLVVNGISNINSPLAFEDADVADLQKRIKIDPLYKNWASKSSYKGV